MKSRRFAFSLVEVVIALTIALLAASFVHEGLGLATAAGRRQAFHERCTRFLRQDFEPLLAQIELTGESIEGDVPGSGPRIGYRLDVRQEPGIARLLRITVRFTPPTGPAGPRAETFDTFRSPLLKANFPSGKTEGTKP